MALSHIGNLILSESYYSVTADCSGEESVSVGSLSEGCSSLGVCDGESRLTSGSLSGSVLTVEELSASKTEEVTALLSELITSEELLCDSVGSD